MQHIMIIKWQQICTKLFLQCIYIINFFFQKLNHMFLVISVTENKIRIKENESHSKQEVPD